MEADTEKNTPVEIYKEVMMHMFRTYAAFLSFQRAATTLLDTRAAIAAAFSASEYLKTAPLLSVSHIATSKPSRGHLLKS